MKDATTPSPEPKHKDAHPAPGGLDTPPPRRRARRKLPEDASRKEVIFYAFGNVENSIADQFFNVLQNVMIVAMHVNPLLMGLILGVKTLWDGITDPIMAYVTDNTKSRWGRRIPYIFVGSISRVLLLLGIVMFIPTGGHLTSNTVMEAQKFASESINEARRVHRVAVQAYEQIDSLDPAARERLMVVLTEIEETAKNADAQVEDNFATLQLDLGDRQLELERRNQELAVALEASPPASLEEESRSLRNARGLVLAAEEKVGRAETLIEQTRMAQRQAIATEYISQHLWSAYGTAPEADLTTPEMAQTLADATYAERGLEPMNIFELEVRPPPTPSVRKGFLSSITDGIAAFLDAKNIEQRSLVIYVLIAVLLFTTLTTIQSVPYYALGIELSPSYNGRTQVVTYRAVMNKVAGLIQPWIPVFCFSLLFATAIDGLFWVALGACIIGIPSTVLMCWYVKERTQATVKKKGERQGIFRSMWQVGNNGDFLRILGLQVLVGLSNGVFQQIGFFLNVYWVMGSALSGAVLGAWVSMLAWVLGLFSLPLINWGCRRFQKHRVLIFAIIWMAIGTALKWWCMNPDHPEYQFILPFFFSIGIGSVYTVLPTMMADVTDVDELKHGVRREGMFGAVMAFLQKTTGTFTPILAGAVLVMAGFDPALEYEQTPETIFRMRLLYSFVPAGMLLFALLLLWRYPLNAERVRTIKEELHRRHEEAEDAYENGDDDENEDDETLPDGAKA